MPHTRRRFLHTAAGVAAGGLLLPGRAPAAGPDYAVQGIDVSSYQGTVNWASVRGAGITFGFTKATEGATYTNPTFAANWANMRANRIVRGAYHYGRPQSDPVAQADFFVSTVQPGKGDLQLVLDIETTDGKTPAQVGGWVTAFLNQLQARTGRPGIVYTGFYFWRDQAGNNASNQNCPLWLAAYTTSTSGLIPAAWNTWSFWQYTSSGSVAGVSGNVDRNAWNGSLTALNSLRLP
jgi:lysozyme